MRKESISAAARALANMRKIHAGGRPKTMRPCQKCNKMFSARDLRQHKPRCVVSLPNKPICIPAMDGAEEEEEEEQWEHAEYKNDLKIL